MSDSIKRRLSGERWCNFCGGDHAPIVCPTHDRLPSIEEMGELVGQYGRELIAGDPTSVQQSEATLRAAMERLYARVRALSPQHSDLPIGGEK